MINVITASEMYEAPYKKMHGKDDKNCIDRKSVIRRMRVQCRDYGLGGGIWVSYPLGSSGMTIFV